MDDFERELKVGFLEEAAQAITDVEQCFLDLETDPNNIDHINKIFRLAHNLKGSSKAVGFDQFGQFTHEFESFVLKVKNKELEASAKVVSLFLRVTDHVAKMIEGLKENLEATFDCDALSQEMLNFTQDTKEAPAEDAAPPQEPELAPELESVLSAALESEVSNESVAPQLSIVADEAPIASEAAPAMEAVVPPAQIEAALEAKAKPPAPATGSGNAARGATDESIRVSLAKVEKLINFVGEMVILQAVLSDQASSSTNMLLRKTVHQLGKVGKEIQDLSMGLRMVPIKPTFQKMQRIVRDTSQALGKDVGLHLLGEETELDKTILERINDPLVHLIRNSVDHGVESAEQRRAAGKVIQGRVDLRAFHKSGRLVIEVADDGGGLNAEKLKNKAIEKGILKANANLTEEECYKLIFAPGFSTKEQVTDVSGRGVGMDVVRTNIEDLGGEIQIESKLGVGTTFRIGLPLTLAIIDSMVISVSDEKFVIPLSHVAETLQPKAEMIQPTSTLGPVLMLRGENMPMLRLGDFFGVKSTKPEEEMIAMIFRGSQKTFALLVDDILGQFQVVIKQLSPDLQGFQGVAGTTILGDGKPALILEPHDLVKRKWTYGFVEKKKEGPMAGGKAA